MWTPSAARDAVSPPLRERRRCLQATAGEVSCSKLGVADGAAMKLNCIWCRIYQNRLLNRMCCLTLARRSPLTRPGRRQQRRRQFG